MEDRDYNAMDMIHLFVVTSIDRATGYSARPWLTMMHTTYSDLLNAQSLKEVNAGIMQETFSMLLK